MAKPNYSFEKRQRELEKKRKKEEKAKRKAPLTPESDGRGDTDADQHDAPKQSD